MTEKRKHERHLCSFKAHFTYFEPTYREGTGEKRELVPHEGKGTILDISRGGVFLVCDERVNVGTPLRLTFKSKVRKQEVEGQIVRTGLLRNNPSEVAQRFSHTEASGEIYIAVEFSTPLPEFLPGEV